MTSLNIVESVCFSYPENSAKENQDSILLPIKTQQCLYMAIADGVGGLAGGATASSAAIDAIRQEILISSNKTIEELFDIAQKFVSEAASLSENQKEMATTLVVCKVSKCGIEIGSTGDSRAYSLNSGELFLLTKDHTEKQELIDKKIFKEEELDSHYSGSSLTSSISAKNNFKINKYRLSASSGSIVLMTDGAYHFVDAKKVSSIRNMDLISTCFHIRKAIKKPIDDFSLVAMRFEIKV